MIPPSLSYFQLTPLLVIADTFLRIKGVSQLCQLMLQSRVLHHELASVPLVVVEQKIQCKLR